ncbi:hypothetical protein DM01DRAFT_1041954 [Hesseltinella vesiculosa]|uniref:BZIP domain-containing protein n=1 Tax=Hesseltinella vesiculosa TaxID=101127 RepID=A0A1X2GHM6_9FUNG|nr:hypothetical protein DM01DRAFT_1041954 [Hesseltinella vesiculosa]
MDPKSVLVENAASVNVTTEQLPSNVDSQPPSSLYQVSNSPPMAVLPLNSSAKLDQEPNPFEQSFSSVSKQSLSPEPVTLKIEAVDRSSSRKSKDVPPSSSSSVSVSTASTASSTATSEPLKLPPVAAMTSPNPIPVMSSVPKDIANQYAWDSLRAGPLSPSMLQRPANPEDFAFTSMNPTNSLLSYQSTDYQSSSYPAQQANYGSSRYQAPTSNPLPKYQPEKQSPLTRKSSNASTTSTLDQQETTPSTAPRRTSTNAVTGQRRKKDAAKPSDEDKIDSMDDLDEATDSKKRRTDDEDEKRRNFLERNRLAALKCRQRKKQWLSNLQAKVEFLTSDNERLQMETNAMREEIMHLKALLMQHKDCPVSQANGFPTDLLTNANATPNKLSTHPTPGMSHPPHPHHHHPGTLLHPAPTATLSPTNAPSSTPVSMASMYTSTNPPPTVAPPSQPPQATLPPVQRLPVATTSTMNMVMVPPHVPATASSTMVSSSGVLQF